MAFCTNCGNQMPDGTKFCTSCGAVMTNGNAVQPESQPQDISQPNQQQAQQQVPPQQHAQPHAQPQMQQQAYQQQYNQQQPQMQSQYQPQYAAPAPHLEEPISTGGYVGIFLLMMIPLVNLVCLLVWACGGCKKENKKNMSRAMLILMLIGLLLGGAMILAGNMLFGDVLGELGEALNA